MIQAGVSLLDTAVADGLNWAPPPLLLLLLLLHDNDNDDEGGIVVTAFAIWSLMKRKSFPHLIAAVSLSVR